MLDASPSTSFVCMLRLDHMSCTAPTFQTLAEAFDSARKEVEDLVRRVALASSNNAESEERQRQALERDWGSRQQSTTAEFKRRLQVIWGSKL